MSDVQKLDINGTSYDIKALSVVDRGGGNLKFWSGTKDEYDAIITKDSNTLYNITDDTDVTLSLLELLYPVGAIYIGTMNACPLQALGVGTWQLVAANRVLQGAGSGTVGSTVEAGLPNITATWSGMVCNGYTTSGAVDKLTNLNGGVGGNNNYGYSFDASRSSSIYGNSNTVQPPAYLVNIWERIS